MPPKENIVAPSGPQNIQGGPENKDIALQIVTLSLLNDFQNFYTVRKLTKFTAIYM